MVSDIPAGDGKIDNLFLQCMMKGGRKGRRKKIACGKERLGRRDVREGKIDGKIGIMKSGERKDRYEERAYEKERKGKRDGKRELMRKGGREREMGRESL